MTESFPAKPYPAKCLKCGDRWDKPPKNWDCPKCQVKVWQPDDDAACCQQCGAPVAKFSRHHCRQCGRVTCAQCTQYTTVIPEWSPTEKVRVCKGCVVPPEPPAISGYLEKLGAKNLFGTEKFNRRYFQLRGTALMYANDESAPFHGLIDLRNAKVMDVASRAHAFCIIGPKLQRGYVLAADNDEQKNAWVRELNQNLRAAANSNGPAGGPGGAQGNQGGAGGMGDLQEEVTLEEKTESMLFSHARHGPQAVVSMVDFDLLTVLGIGSFGRVMKVRERSTGKIFAMKVMDKQMVIQNRMVDHTQAEKDILGGINHPFIVKLHYAFQTRKHLVLVLDFLCGGELFFHLQRSKRFSESRARMYCAEIGTALDYIHSSNIIYRDLKPENLVLDREGHCILTDFGLAKRNVVDMTHTFCGTPEYMAPELITKQGHTKAVDWWSLGVFLYEMVAGLPPFYSQNVNEMYELILHRPLKCPPFFSRELQNLCERLLDRDPSKRMQTGQEFRSHPFFREIDWDKLMDRKLKPEFVPDVAQNDLKYFDKQFTQENVAMPVLHQPNDPNDATSKKFANYEYNPDQRQFAQGPGSPNSNASPPGLPKGPQSNHGSPAQQHGAKSNAAGAVEMSL